MSELKMSDVFNVNSIGFPAHWTDNQVRYADNAIKNHDKLTKQNQELIGMLEQTYEPVRMAYKQGCDMGPSWVEYNNLLTKIKGES